MHRVLVVDDDQLVADTLAMIFGMSGFMSRAKYSTDAALACVPEFLPDLLVCDIQMPERSGLELMREVSRSVPECRILVLTGYTYHLRRVVEESSYLLSSVAVLTKPCPPAKLLREASTMLRAGSGAPTRLNGTAPGTWKGTRNGERYNIFLPQYAQSAE